jgi:hypothetical protein
MPEIAEAQPFQEAIDHFRQKLNVPSERWTDIWQGAHTRAFTVAGAQSEALLADFRTAIDRAISEGRTLKDFQKDFDAIVEKHGWSYKGSRGWRTRTIYRTNMRTAYQAGRYKQMTDPKVLKRRPFWEYAHGDSVNPRPKHLGWDGLVLRHDDPTWDTIYPPNGWGCSCFVRTLSQRGLERRGKSEPDAAPELEMRKVRLGDGSEVEVPKGIDPGWAYNVGEAAHGRPVARQSIDTANAQGWRQLPGRTAADYGRPATVPADTPKAKPGRRADSMTAMRERLRQSVGGDEVQLTDPAGDKLLVSQAMADHIAADPKRLDGREKYFPLLPEVVEDPYEIWVSFARNEATGKVGLRKRYVKTFDLEKERPLIVVADAAEGVWTGLTYNIRRPKDLDAIRQGHLVYGRDETD